MIHDSASTPEIVAKQRAQEMWSVRLYLQPSVASVAISSVTRLLDGLEQENKKAAYSLHFTTVTMVFASIVSFHPWSLVDPGEGARPPLFLDQTEAWRAENIFLETAPLSSKGLDDPPPPLISRSGPGAVDVRESELLKNPGNFCLLSPESGKCEL